MKKSLHGRKIFFRNSSKTIYFQQLSKINKMKKKIFFKNFQKFSKSRVKTALQGMKRIFFSKFIENYLFSRTIKNSKKKFFIRIGTNGPIWTPKSRTRFFPDMRFSLNVQEQYALSFKTHFK